LRRNRRNSAKESVATGIVIRRPPPDFSVGLCSALAAQLSARSVGRVKSRKRADFREYTRSHSGRAADRSQFGRSPRGCPDH
jgi:hypothetical protein